MSSLKETFFNQKTNLGIVTFQNAKNEPLHRWFPYLEGFGEDFIETVFRADNTEVQWIYEPFSGSGTVPVYAAKHGVNCYYQEVNPYMAKVSKVKLEALTTNSEERNKLKIDCIDIIELYKSQTQSLEVNKDLEDTYNRVFSPSVYFDADNFTQVLKSKSFLIDLEHNKKFSTLSKRLLWLAMSESLLHSSLLKRAGDIRFKRGKEKDNIPRFIVRVEQAFKNIIEDLEIIPYPSRKIELQFSPNSKTQLSKTNFADIIVTSPPYLNGTNYIRNSKLELWFDSLLKNKGDLSYYRNEVVTAGINDVTKENKDLEFSPLNTLFQQCNSWYDRRIPKMINDYFFDMRIVLNNCYLALKENKAMYLDIGDSIYGGNYIPTHEFLSTLAEEIGFKHEETITLRSRKSKDGSELSQVLIKLVK